MVNYCYALFVGIFTRMMYVVACCNNRTLEWKRSSELGNSFATGIESLDIHFTSTPMFQMGCISFQKNGKKNLFGDAVQYGSALGDLHAWNTKRRETHIIIRQFYKVSNLRIHDSSIRRSSEHKHTLTHSRCIQMEWNRDAL